MPYAAKPPASLTTASRAGATRRAAEAADIPAAPPPITTSRATCCPRLPVARQRAYPAGRAINAGHERACGSAPTAVRSPRDKEPAQARPARPVAPAAWPGQAGCMTERSTGRQAEQPGGDVRDEIAAVVGRAREAARAIEHYSQEQVDELVTAVAWAVVRKDHAEALARQAVDEGGFGNYADKVAKINKRVIGVLADMTGQRTVGVVEEQPAAGLVKIAKPVGVVVAVTATTGPDATPPVKTLFALKGRNAIICAPHPRTQGATEAVVAFMRAACEQVGAPADLVQSLPAPSLPKTQELMRQADLVVATGGAGMVRAAYSSGTPAYGVGVGNAVHVVDETADLADAAAAIMTAKTFDYATSCLADNALVVHADVYDELLRRLTGAGAHLCDQQQKDALRAVMWPDGGPVPTIAVVAKSAAHIAGLAGFSVDPGCPMLLVEEQGTGPDHPFSGEKLSLVLAVYRYRGDIAAAADLVNAITGYQGLGHTCGIHTSSDANVERL